MTTTSRQPHRAREALDGIARANLDDAGPTAERLAHAIEDKLRCFVVVGNCRRGRLFSMLDDGLGRLWLRQKISAEEYTALRRYASHWLAGGLQGALHSVDLNRIYAAGAVVVSGRAQDHRDAYHAARAAIGRRPALVADRVACHGCSLADVGVMLGYRSASHGRAEAREILADAGYRLGQFWKARDR